MDEQEGTERKKYGGVKKKGSGRKEMLRDL